MRILVEPAIFQYGRCGLTRYYAALCEGLTSSGLEIDLPLLASNCDYQPGVAACTRFLTRIPKLSGLLHKLSIAWFHAKVHRGGYDIILVTSPRFEYGVLKTRRDLPFVMVVHDLMTCVTTPDGLYDSAGPSLTNLLYLAARASRIICISNDTRRALIHSGSINERRTTVIHTGNLLAAANPLELSVTLPAHYLLFVGERSGRKNFFWLARSFAMLLEREPDLHLICTGTLLQVEIDYLKRLGIADRVRAVPAPDGVLVHLYRNALCLVYPSLYEGFGLPVLEAMHYGCPVISTDRGALAEVCGRAAMLVDPCNDASLLNALESLTTDSSLRNHHIRLGKIQAGKFQFETMMQSFKTELLKMVRLNLGEEQ